MNYLNQIISDIEEHSVVGIRECFEHGISPNDHYKQAPLIFELTSEYLRSPRFKDCVQAFIDHGLVFEDKVLLAVLANHDKSLDLLLRENPTLIHNRYSLRCAFTPLRKATLLHICAEYNHVACARVLVKHGADVNAPAGFDDNGFGGQTPIFHTVNQILNQSLDMLHFLLEEGADVKHSITGLVWGDGYQWETFIPAINPISYAMMGLLPQMHRNEFDISKIVALLMQAGYGIDYKSPNIPNRYLKH